MDINSEWLEGNGIGKAIKKQRKANKLTQAELAEKVGVSRATISQYETGEMKPSANMFYKLETALGGLFEVYLSDLHSSHGVSDAVSSLLNELKIEWAYADIPDEGFSGIATISNEKPEILISKNDLQSLHNKVLNYFEYEFSKLIKELKARNQ